MGAFGMGARHGQVGECVGSLRHGLLLREEPPERPADRALAFGMGARHGQVGEGVRVEQEDQLADHARQCVA